MPRFRVTGHDRSIAASRTVTVDAETKADAELQGAVLGMVVSSVTFDKEGTVEERQAPLATLAGDAGMLGYETPPGLEMTEAQREMRRLKPWIRDISRVVLVLAVLNVLGCAVLLVRAVVWSASVSRLELAFLLGFALSQACIWAIGAILLRVVGVIGSAVADTPTRDERARSKK